MRPVLRNLLWGIRLGLTFAAVFSAWIVILIVLNGSLTLRLRGGYTANALTVIAAYLWGGMAAGAIVGLARPLGRNRVGAALIGVLAAAPVYAGMRVAVEGLAPWRGTDTLVVAILSVVVGGFGGVGLWEIWHPEARRRRTRRKAGREAER